MLRSRLSSFSTRILFSLVATVLVGLACQPGDAGDQKQSKPVAVAQVAAAGAMVGNAYRVRTGSDVVITGKDSDSNGPPILEWDWVQTGGPTVPLFERTVFARAFTAPLIATTLQFELTVTDAKGKKDTALLNIDVVPVLDADDYLHDPSVDENLSLFISPDAASPSPVPSTIRYSITVTPIVHWTDRKGVARTQALDPVLEVSDQIDAGFVVPVDPLDAAQDRIELPVPMLDADLVNVFFQGANRGGRLEIEELQNATVDLQVDLSGDVGEFQVYAARDNGSGFTLIDVDDLLTTGTGPVSGAILVGDAGGPFGATLDLEKIRLALSIGSRLGAENYYACLDPNDEATTLTDWKISRGFEDVNGVVSPDVMRARYVNNYDLGFGRDMRVRVAANGDVYSYVVNFPSLEQLLKGVNEFATVAMEWSAKPEGKCDAPTFSPTERIVKFYTFVYDEVQGEMVRSASINFDGRGERFMPGVCTACHDGDIASLAGLGASTDLSMIDAANTDLSASFMPWDIDSLLFSRANDPNLADRDLNEEDIPEFLLQAASVEAQEDTLRAMNEATLRTYVDDPVRYEAPIQLIHGWYDDYDAVKDVTTAGAAAISTLPANDFDGTYVQEGWKAAGAQGQLQEDLYYDVFARNCRMCHTQQDNKARNFDTYSEFVNASNLGRYVFERGVMPVARLTYDRFWVDFMGDSKPAAERLREHLLAYTARTDIPATAVPGEPVPDINVSDTLVQAVDGAGELVPTIIDLDGSDSLFAKAYSWTLSDDTPCGMPPSILGDASPQASFVVDRSPCDYTIKLEVDSGTAVGSTSVMVSTDRIPETVAFVAPLTSYTPGDSDLEIDILSQISAAKDGDGGLVLLVDPGSLQPVGPVTDLGSGIVSYELPSVLGGTNESFEYLVRDVNGTDATSAALVTVTVASIEPMVTLNNATATSATIQWTVPAGFVAARYRVQRDGPPPSGSFSTIATTSGFSYTDNSVQSGASYEYRVLAEIDIPSEFSISNALPVQTTVGVPTGLMSTGVTTSSIGLSWSPGVGSSPDSYRVYRDGGLIASPGSPSYNNTGLAQNTTYGYTVSQVIGLNESAQSPTSNFTTNTAQPTSFNATPVTNTSTQISLSWSPPVGGNAPTSYKVYRGGSPLTTTGNLFYTNTGLTTNTTYNYEVSAIGTNGESATRASDSATTYPSFTLAFDTANNEVGCTGCHGTVTAPALTATTLPYALSNPCVSDDSDLSDCNVGMTGYTISTPTRTLILNWIAGGTPN